MGKKSNEIFNMFQADKFVQAGALVERIIKINGCQCIKFKSDDKFLELLHKWNNRLPLD